ncbi:hypothetical protein CAEBREN_10417 [Caenorhabditis brenneri]|uniref:Uncharacterized protein n=1 Tax=Caenorhabditis brenneri TaxID=135651 RepID=G0N088_CAEBE|nr:hypothetical protein CAEBREN_10417 [Caenorhabditis brenneri]
MKYFAHIYPRLAVTAPPPLTTKSINGEWTLISHKDTEEYLKQRNAGAFNDLIFLHANQLFKCENKKLSQIKIIGTQKVFERRSSKNVTSVESNTWLIRNKLRTEINYIIDGCQFKEIEERYVDHKNMLYILNRIYWKTGNKHDVAECTRVYKRELRCLQKSIMTEIVGSWRQVAKDGFEEFRQNVEMSAPEAWDPDTLLDFSHITIFYEIQMQHLDTDGSVLKFESAVISGEPKYAGTFFYDNSLVTVDQGMRIVRRLKDDKLFVTCRKNEHYFVAIYERC